MRQPTFSSKRRRSRRYRLTRTLVVLVVLIIFIAIVVNLFSGSVKKYPLSHVAFTHSVASQSDTSNAASPSAARHEAARITDMLDGWYQTTYVNPSLWGDGTFPGIAKLFTQDARASFTKNIASMSIGDLRPSAVRVVPQTQTAKITVFFVNGRAPKLAVASVEFTARVTLKDKNSPPVLIAQKATYHLEMDGGTWYVAYYSVNQAENSVQPTPSGSAS